MSTLVLVGGTGSLGTAITKQQQILKKHNITRIRVISRDEQKQEILEKNYKGDIELQCFLGDCRDLDRMELALKKTDYVIHMAALKMIDRFELDIPEGFHTNIRGSENIMKASLRNDVKSAILVSTDKACSPINAYGVSKLAASHVWLWGNSFQKKTSFGVALYGNVFGSRGSVIERWHKLAKEKKPLPVTDQEMTRFFITLKNASQFVLDCLFNNQMKIMVPEMKSSLMMEVLNVIHEYHNGLTFPLDYEIVGIRPGEKLHEDISDGKTNQNSLIAKRFTRDEILKMYEEWMEI